MQLAEWQIGGVLMGGVQAAFLLLNQHFRIPARVLMLWRGFGVFAVLLPAALLVGSWPAAPAFYLLTLASGLLIGIFDRMNFHAVMQYGAGAVSRLMALCLPVSFVLWGLLHSGHFSGSGRKAAGIPDSAGLARRCCFGAVHAPFATGPHRTDGPDSRLLHWWND
jgi:hypothetical protein